MHSCEVVWQSGVLLHWDSALDDFESEAKMFMSVDYEEEEEERVRKRSRKLTTHDGPAVETEFNSARDKFKVQVFYTIVENWYVKCTAEEQRT